MGQKQVAVMNRREKCRSKQDLWMCRKSRVLWKHSISTKVMMSLKVFEQKKMRKLSVATEDFGRTPRAMEGG